MPLLRKTLEAFAYGHLLISACAASMAHQATRLYSAGRPDGILLVFMAASTLCIYGFHALLHADAGEDSERSDWTRRHRTYAIAASATALLTACLSLPFAGIHAGYACAVAAATAAYLSPKRAGGSLLSLTGRYKSLLLALTWTVATTLMPLPDKASHVGIPLIGFIIERFLLIYAVCLFFDFRDRRTDAANGIRTIAVRLEPRRFRVYVTLVVAAYLASAVANDMPFAAGGFRVAPLLTGAALALLSPYSLGERSGLFHYIVLDGLMAFPSLPWVSAWVLGF